MKYFYTLDATAYGELLCTLSRLVYDKLTHTQVPTRLLESTSPPAVVAVTKVIQNIGTLLSGYWMVVHHVKRRFPYRLIAVEVRGV